MCQYAGGKVVIGERISKAILEYELEITGSNDLPYFEPFSGMCGVLLKICKHSPDKIKFACDKEICVMNLWKDLQNGWTPPLTMNIETYKNIRHENKEDSLYCFAAYGCSFKGMRWAGYYDEAFDIATNRLKKNDFQSIVKDVCFMDPCSYTDHEPYGMIVYCDPPYINSNFIKDRENLCGFNIEEFWNTVRKWSVNNIVLVSERHAPEDFVSIWEYTRMNGITQNNKIVEKLFVLKTA